MTHADAFPLSSCRRRGPLGGQSGHLDAGALPEHAAAVGARHRRLRVRAGADDRKQGRQGALPDAADASAPVAAVALIPVSPKSPKQRRIVMIHPSTFLSRALLADAIFSGVSAVGLTLGAGMLAPFLNLPEALLRETGLFLIAYTALVGWLASRSSVPNALVLLVSVGNAAWTLGSVALLFSGAVAPSLLGEIVVVAQAIATGVFAELQYIGLRKSGGTVTA